jgi:hypothetical protein
VNLLWAACHTSRCQGSGPRPTCPPVFMMAQQSWGVKPNAAWRARVPLATHITGGKQVPCLVSASGNPDAGRDDGAAPGRSCLNLILASEGDESGNVLTWKCRLTAPLKRLVFPRNDNIRPSTKIAAEAPRPRCLPNGFVLVPPFAMA